jgi:hypothetical protein
MSHAAGFHLNALRHGVLDQADLLLVVVRRSDLIGSFGAVLRQMLLGGDLLSLVVV